MGDYSEEIMTEKNLVSIRGNATPVKGSITPRIIERSKTPVKTHYSKVTHFKKPERNEGVLIHYLKDLFIRIEGVKIINT